MQLLNIVYTRLFSQNCFLRLVDEFYSRTQIWWHTVELGCYCGAFWLCISIGSGDSQTRECCPWCETRVYPYNSSGKMRRMTSQCSAWRSEVGVIMSMRLADISLNSAHMSLMVACWWKCKQLFMRLLRYCPSRHIKEEDCLSCDRRSP